MALQSARGGPLAETLNAWRGVARHNERGRHRGRERPAEILYRPSRLFFDL
jgi:hypothetical protein